RDADQPNSGNVRAGDPWKSPPNQPCRLGNPMDFDLSVAQHKRFAEISSAVQERFGELPPATRPHLTRHDWKAAADLGLAGLCLPAEYGGQDLGALDTALCLEAFGRSCPDTGLVFALSAH